MAFLTAYGGADDEETGSVLAVERNSSEEGGPQGRDALYCVCLRPMDGSSLSAREAAECDDARSSNDSLWIGESEWSGARSSATKWPGSSVM